MTCKDCIHERVCDALITNGLPYADGKYPAEAFCMTFRNKADFVEVVRCEICKYCKTHTCAITGKETLFCDYGNTPVAVEPEHFCGYGERRDT